MKKSVLGFKGILLSKYGVVLLGISLVMLTILGCSTTPSFYIRQDIDFSYIKKVAVLPLENLTSDRFAGENVSQLVINELLASGLCDVVVPGEALSMLDTLRLKSTQTLKEEHIKAIGNTLGVQAVIFGSVEKFGEVRMGNISAPEVTITLIMAETDGGSIIWSVTCTRGGASFWDRHFGTRADTLSETSIKVVREAVQTLM